MRWLAAVALSLLLAGPARAALTAADTAQIGVFPPPHATAPLGLAFTDDGGRPTTLGAAMGGKPALLIFSDYRCTSLCGPALLLAKAALEGVSLKPGRDYRLVVIGIDPRDGPAAAAAMRAQRIADDPPLSRAASFLSGPPAAIAAATRALGFRYRYDAEHDVYAHPVAAYALTADGHPARVISEIGFRPADLRSALVEAGRGQVDALAYPIHLLCYCFDTAVGLYDGGVLAALQIGGGAVVLAMALGLVVMVRRGARP